MLRRAEPRSRTSWCQSFRAKREIRSFRHIADQRVAPFCGGAPCACTVRPYQPEGFCGSTDNNTARSEAGAVRRGGSTGGNGGQLCVRNERGKARGGQGSHLALATSLGAQIPKNPQSSKKHSKGVMGQPRTMPWELRVLPWRFCRTFGGGGVAISRYQLPRVQPRSVGD